MLYRVVDGRLERLSDDGFPKEKDLQTFVEDNIGELIKYRCCGLHRASSAVR